MTRTAISLLIALAASAAIGAGAARAQTATPIEATTPAGDKVLLHPDGRWEYADPVKRAAAPKPAAPAPATTADATPTAAGGCQPGAQGLFGRCINPGDKDYNRGSLSGKGR